MQRDDDARTALQGILLDGVEGGVFPGAVAAVGQLRERGTSQLLAWAGTRSAGGPEVAPETPYDLASLTKPFVAMAALRLAQQGKLDLAAPIAVLLPALADTPGGESSLGTLLCHRAGLAAWSSLFLELGAGVLPGSVDARTRMLDLAARRSEPVRGPGSVYSDLGYLLAGEAIACAAGSSLAEVVQHEVTAPLGITDVAYAAALDERARDALATQAAATEMCLYRGRLLQGEVHDENCHAFGGVAGHAGLFGTASSVLCFGLSVLAALEGRSRWLDQGLLRWALRSRGPGYLVGWDQKSPEGSSAGAHFSAQSFGHLGFTGTSLWCDPTRRLCAVLLTNRVHPTRENIAIRAYRPRFHDLVCELLS